MFSDQLENTALVVAHPDDEILWFSSIVREVSAGFICFGESKEDPVIGTGRESVARDFPLQQFEFLQIPESGVFNLDNWISPTITEYGMKVQGSPNSNQQYIKNFTVLHKILSEKLASYATVVTHNPWGEYGHEEHVQVHRVVKQICADQGKTLMYTNYCSDRSVTLMRKSIRGFSGEVFTRDTDIELARELESLYRQHNIWTWPFQGYPYFPSESFVVDVPRTSRRLPGSRIPLNYIEVDGFEVHKKSVSARAASKLKQLFKRPTSTGPAL